MNFPTGDQIKSATRTVSISLSTLMAGAAMVHIVAVGDPQKVIDAVNMIGDGVASIVTGVGMLTTVGMGVWGVVTASPLRKLFSSTKTIAADPAAVRELQQATIADKAPLALLTDKLPEVAAVGTTRTDAGKALADAVPSITVHPVNNTFAKAV